MSQKKWSLVLALVGLICFTLPFLARSLSQRNFIPENVTAYVAAIGFLLAPICIVLSFLFLIFSFLNNGGLIMKIIIGVVWFSVISFLLTFIGSCTSTYVQRSMGVAKENIAMPSDLIILVISVALAVWGTVNGKLPGTKKK